MALPSNQLDAAIARIKCCRDSANGPFPAMEYKAVVIGLLLRQLALTYPDQMVASSGLPLGECENYLPSILTRIECGDTLRDEQEFWEVFARIQIANRDGAIAASEAGGTYVWRSGVYNWPDTGTTNSVSVIGLLATDLVFAVLTERDATQTLVLVANDFANDEIDLTLSAAGSTDCVVTWQVMRPIPV